MDTQQALAIVLQAAELAALPKSGHLQVEAAAKILTDLVNLATKDVAEKD